MRRPRVTGSDIAVLGDAVNRLVNKFEYPDSDTLPPPPTFGDGGGMMTVTVSALNATGMSQAKSDIQCSGTNDHVQIMEAIDICSTVGGTVWLSEGTFFIAPDRIVVPRNVILRGLGYGTIIDFGEPTAWVVNVEGELKDMRFHPGGT